MKLAYANWVIGEHNMLQFEFRLKDEKWWLAVEIEAFVLEKFPNRAVG